MTSLSPHTASPHHRHRGVAVLLVMFAVAVASVLALSFVSRQSTTIGIRENIDAHGRARAIAESGLRLALQRISKNDAWFTDGTATSWAGANGSAWQAFSLGAGETAGRYRVKIDALPADHKTAFSMTAEGQWGDAVEQVRATVTPVPRAGTILMIVGTLPLTDPGDLRMREMFEAWGYTVKLLSNDTVKAATAAQMDAHAAAAGVIYVSTTVASGDIGAKLNAVKRGAVATETQLNDEWGFSSGYSDSLANADKIYVLDATHDITTAFGAGSETITEQPAKLRYLSGTFAPNAKWLARHNTDAAYRAVATLEKDAVGYNSVTAPARRVILPWSAEADPSWLTASGQKLVQESLEWAAITPETRPFGVATKQYMRLYNSARIDASAPAAYSTTTNATGLALVATNGTAANSIGVYSSAVMNADAYSGMGSDPTAAIKIDATAQFSGTQNPLRLPLSFDTINRPTTGASRVTYPFHVPPTYTSLYPMNIGPNPYPAGHAYNLENFYVYGGGTMRINGHVVAVVEGRLTVDNVKVVLLNTSSSLTIYAREMVLVNGAELNVAPVGGQIRSSLVNLYMDGLAPLTINGSKVAASVHGPYSEMSVVGASRFFGRYVGLRLTMSNTSRYTQDLSLGQPAAGTGGATLAPTYRYVPRWIDQR